MDSDEMLTIFLLFFACYVILTNKSWCGGQTVSNYLPSYGASMVSCTDEQHVNYPNAERACNHWLGTSVGNHKYDMCKEEFEKKCL